MVYGSHDVRVQRVRCYVDGVLLHEVDMRPIPSLVSVATLDKENRVIYLKVVNTTRHERRPLCVSRE